MLAIFIIFFFYLCLAAAFAATSDHNVLLKSALSVAGGSVYHPSKSSSTALCGTTNGTLSSSILEDDGINESTTTKKRPLRVLFLSADTGGGHRASAESLARQFQIHFPGSTYDLLDVWTLDGVYPYKTLVKSYTHLSAHPKHWSLFYHSSNIFPVGSLANIHSNVLCGRRIKRRIAGYDPDVIVSVHPAMNNAPRIATRKLMKEHGKYIPFFTVVTDLGSGHSHWFEKKVDKLYVASERIFKLARRRGRTPSQNIVMTGLPIRQDFALQSQKLNGDRTTEDGKKYQKQVKTNLSLSNDRPMVLVMGGGEGVGSLSQIVDQLHDKFVANDIDATICVVCGRNEKLQTELKEKDWNKNNKSGSTVEVIGLGYVDKMADYMVAADVLVSKAGPGTIAEAAAVGLPVMMTSFLPGQEAGNVDVVIDAGFGEYCKRPSKIASRVSEWLKDEALLQKMSQRATQMGNPTAASDIVLDIGTITQAWIDANLEASNGKRKSILSSSSR